MNPSLLLERWERARLHMQRRELDAILVGDKYNYWYFTGHLSREFDKKMRPMIFLLPRKGSPVWVGYGQAEAALKKVCAPVQCYGYEDVPFPTSILKKVFVDRDLLSAQIGMEFGENERLGLSYDHFRDLAGDLPDCRFLDAGEILQQLRLIKAPSEIEMIRQACKISLTAWEKAVPRFQIGFTNHEIGQILAAELCLAGSDFNVAGHVTVGNGVAGETGYTAGQTVWCDFGASFQGYQADLARRAVFEPVSDRQLQVHQQISSILSFQIEAIGPGKAACDVAAVVSEQLESHGYSPLGTKKRVGHGLGLSSAEPPSLSLADETILQTGMVLTPEPRFFLESGEKVHIEEVVVVTEDGCQKLTDGAEHLTIIQ